ncbi:occludin/ELL domain-containing protein 1 [Nyctibius grandis]|uniref:occludin/ELL domain-containing protein 1 n=1 Tax=Nyctibius grandis TaxID=48427 RepID=UPI0035BC06D1
MAPSAPASPFLILTVLLCLAGSPRPSTCGGTRWPGSTGRSPGVPPVTAPPARAKHVVFEDEVAPSGRPPGRVPPAADGDKPGARSVPPGLAPRARAVPDYVVKYPAIRSPRQREGYKGVFQDQLAEYTELLGDVRAARRRLGDPQVATGRLPPRTPSRTDRAFLEKQQRCEYLKQKLTHIKARIREYDRDARGTAGCSGARAPTGTHAAGR